jgi:hypothetical protein
MAKADVETTDVPAMVEQPKRKSTTLVGGEGSKEQRLTILAQRKADGTGVVAVTVLDVKTNKATRGMTQRFAEDYRRVITHGT